MSARQLSRWADALVLLAVGALSFAAFLPALGAEFVALDDDRLFLSNPGYRGLDLQHLGWMFTTNLLGHYMPVTWISHAIDFEISGLAPASYHFQNLVLHALCAILFALLVRHLIALALPEAAREHPASLRLAAGAAALLFSLHPLRVEPVAWATERREILGAFFLLLATLAWLRACPPGEVRLVSRGAYVAAILLLVLAVLSKAMGMTFVLVAVALDVFPLRRLPVRPREWGRRDLRGLWVQKLPLLVLGLLSAAAAGWAQHSAGIMVRTLEQWSVGARLVQACYGLAFYLWRSVWPRNLVPLYELPLPFDPWEPRFLAAYATLAAGAVFLFWNRRSRTAWTVATCLYAILLLPVLGFAQSGPQLVADRYSYLPCLAWASLAGGGLFLLWTRRGRALGWTSAALLAGLLALFFGMSWRQTRTWHDTRTMWTHALEVGEPTALAHVGLGVLDVQEKRLDESLEHFREAARIRPDYGTAWEDLGMNYSDLGRYEEAEKAWIEAVRTRRPVHPVLTRLGLLYLHHLARPEEGVACLRGALADARASNDEHAVATATLRLGAALQETGRTDEARKLLEDAARRPFTRAEALRLLGS